MAVVSFIVTAYQFVCPQASWAGNGGHGAGAGGDASRELSRDFDLAIEQKMELSSPVDQWFAAYLSGRMVQADKLWADLLVKYKNKEEIGDILENINQRSWFAENKKPIEAVKVYEHLLECTEKDLGADHRFVADICSFLATYYESVHEYERALAYRKRDLLLHQRALGAENRQVAEANQEIGHLLLRMKKYDPAEAYLRQAINVASRKGYAVALRKATADLAQADRMLRRKKIQH